MDLPLPQSSESVIFRDCQELLLSWDKKYKNQPEEYYRKLCLLALEREQLVSFAYQDDIISRRLTALELDSETEKLFRYALLQLWRDEEAHTIFVRGLLVEDSKLRRNLGTLIQQIAGFLSGWSSALKHHVPRSNAFLRSLLVDGLALGGRLVGRLSPELRAELGYKSFKEYCLYNVEAERTAQLCWRKLVELDNEIDRGNTKFFERITREEEEHRQVFALIGDSLNTSDRLQEAWDVPSFKDKLERIGPRFVHPDYRSQTISQGSVGQGGEVHVLSNEFRDKHAAIKSQLAKKFVDVAGKSVAIKTSWMMGYSLKDTSSITDPELLRTVVTQLRNLNAAKVTLIESPNIYSDIYENHDVQSVATYFGIDQIDAIIEDTSQASVPIKGTVPLGPKRISKAWAQADVRLSLCHLRSHPIESAYLTSANLEGVIEGNNTSVFWNRSYEYFIGASTVGIVAAPDYAIIDAWDNCPDGWFGIMAGRKPKSPNRLYCGEDCLAVDLTALSHIDDATIASPTLQSMIEWFGDPRPNTKIVGIDQPIKNWRSPHRNTLSSLFSDIACKIYSWLSKSGAIFTPQMDPLFVEKRPIPLLVKPIRNIARIVLGLRPPSDNGK